MKRQTLIIICLSSVLVFLTTTLLLAGIGSILMKVNIPFSFTLSDTKMPAGTYLTTPANSGTLTSIQTLRSENTSFSF